MEKPKSSWQLSWVAEDGVHMLRVHEGEEGSPVYFEGPEHWYDGSATHSSDMPLGYRYGSYKRYMEFVQEFGEHPDTYAARAACYKTGHVPAVK